VKVLVTGSSGFIGAHLVNAIKKSNPSFQLLGIDVEASNTKIEEIEISITAPEASKVISDFAPDIIFHLAAQTDVTHSMANPLMDAESNYIGTINILNGIKGSNCHKVVYANSGGAIYAHSNTLPNLETDFVFPISPYGVSKYASELILKIYSDIYNYKFISLRLSNVYGPGQKSNAVTRMINCMLKKETFTIYGDGSSTRDYVYIKDVVNAFLAAGEVASSGIYNISSGEEISLTSLVDALEKISKTRLDKVSLPFRQGEVLRSCLSRVNAREGLNWEPKYSLPEGLGMTFSNLAHDAS
jgi:UDP-glucose 4-epimerase